MRKNKILEEISKSFYKFIKDCGKRVVVFFHDDCDGICSATLFSRIIRKNLGILPKAIPLEHEGKMPKMKNFSIFFLDISPDKELIDELKKNNRVLVLDHHKLEKYEGIAYLNPRKYRNVYLPTTYLVYNLDRNYLKNVVWIAGVGVIGDFGVRSCKDVFREIKKIYPELVGSVEIENTKLFENSKLGSIVKLIESARTLKKSAGTKFVYKILLEEDDYRKILENEKLKEWDRILRKEFRKILKEFKEKKIEKGNLIFYKFKSKYKLNSQLATYLSSKYKKIIIIASDGKILNISLRRGKSMRKNLLKILEKACHGIESSWGGHPQAAGCRLKRKYLGIFLKRLGI